MKTSKQLEKIVHNVYHIHHILGVHHAYDAHYVQMVNHEKYSLCHQNYGLLPNLKQCTKGMLSQRKGKSRIVG